MGNDNNSEQQSSTAESEQWSAVAKQWGQIGQPLRPTGQDIEFASQAVRSWVERHGVPRALILGVTPELYNLPWPTGTDITAVDHTQAMIDVVWPGPKDAAICAEWTDMPVPDSSRDIIFCDGGLILLPYPDGHRKLVRELKRVLSPGGIIVLRLFAPPGRRENPDAVLADLLESKIANLNLLKLRLGMAMQQDAYKGIAPHEVWSAVHDVAPDLEQLAERIEWPVEQMLALNAYRNRTLPYHFLGIDEVVALFCESGAGFELESHFQPTYELGDCCPTIVLKKI